MCVCVCVCVREIDEERAFKPCVFINLFNSVDGGAFVCLNILYVCMYIYVCMYVCMYIYIYICIHIYSR